MDLQRRKGFISSLVFLRAQLPNQTDNLSANQNSDMEMSEMESVRREVGNVGKRPLRRGFRVVKPKMYKTIPLLPHPLERRYTFPLYPSSSDTSYKKKKNEEQS